LSLLEVRDVTKRFGGLVALDSVGLNVDEGEIVGLIGPNGAGKTTLFNCVTGFYRPDSGEIQFKGESLLGLKPHQICLKGVARTFQIVKAFHSMSVAESVATGALARTDDMEQARKKTANVLNLIGLSEKKNVPIRNLTIVDRKRLGLGCALATDPKLMLLDEVAAGLNPVEIEQVTDLIRRIRDLGFTLLVVEHVMKLIMPVADRIVVLHHGKKIAEGEPSDVARNESVIEAYLGRE
jgi:branched-chain amino acid transport system ATP-binding protein